MLISLLNLLLMGYTIFGTVVDAQTGKPLSGVSVGTNTPLYHTPSTDASGRWYTNSAVLL